MQELRTGIISNKELADWFGIKPASFLNVKQKKLQELEEYADFIEEKGKIVINEIYQGIYQKKKSENYEIVRNSLSDLWCPNNLDTCKNVMKKIRNKYGNKLKIKDSTLYKYTVSIREELFGKPMKETEGSLGQSKYQWVKEVNGNINTYEPFTSEEEKLFQSLAKKYFGDPTEKMLFIKDMIRSGELSKEEAWSILAEFVSLDDRGFVNFLYEAKEKIGYKIVRATLIERKTF